MNSFDQAVHTYHAALGDFMKGNPEPVRRLFSERDDVVLCNPLHPFARGPNEVATTLEIAASHAADGTWESERVAGFSTAELAYIIEIERFEAIVDGSPGSGSLRVTTIFRLEEDGWRIVHRHADPITTPRSMESALQT